MNKNQKYQQELFAQRTPYLQWLRAQEDALERQYGQKPDTGALGKQMHRLPFSSCMDRLQDYGTFAGDMVYLFVKDGGSLSAYAKAVLLGTFQEHTDTVLAYADEDYRGSLKALYGIGDGVFDDAVTVSCADSPSRYRGAPWFKPDFSPDTLASFFYIGSVFAVRGDVVLRMIGAYGNGISIYELVYRIFMEVLSGRHQENGGRIVHVPQVLYTNNRLEDAGRLECSAGIKALYENCIPDKEIPDKDIPDKEIPDKEIREKVSVIIPSKDNVQVLQKCLETLTWYTAYDNYEIILVDNGSSPEQRLCITGLMDALRKDNPDLVIRYLYRERAFNFSEMCNAGAQSADGSHLLFLNDDIEVMDTGEGGRWLAHMVKYARKSHVGAVGAKLYYPPETKNNTCYKIQHTGITNMGIGPAHKLCGMVDEGCLYHGHNTQNYDMLAVTAACMLVRRSVFEAVGGFDEAFAVAYNDVAFCFRLYQQGYFNVQVNEAVLLHHESLSRGQDTSPEKQKRLSEEKERLYQKYPLFNARDPFYSPNLVQWKKDVDYNTGYLYDFDRLAEPVLLAGDGKDGRKKHMIFKTYDFRNLLDVRCGPAAKIYDRLTGYHDLMLSIDSVRYEDCGTGITGVTGITGITIEGWFAVRNADNADLPRKLWLIYEVRNFDYRTVYEFDIAPKLREDVAALLEGNDGRKRTRNTALSGIQVNIEKGVLKAGTYRIGVLCNNKLVCDPEKYVKIPDGDTDRKE